MNTAKRIETWVWVLVYLGLATLGLGLSVSRNSAAVGGAMSFVGVALVIAGAVLVYMRSRIDDADAKAAGKPPAGKPPAGKPLSPTDKEKKK